MQPTTYTIIGHVLKYALMVLLLLLIVVNCVMSNVRHVRLLWVTVLNVRLGICILMANVLILVLLAIISIMAHVRCVFRLVLPAVLPILHYADPVLLASICWIIPVSMPARLMATIHKAQLAYHAHRTAWHANPCVHAVYVRRGTTCFRGAAYHLAQRVAP